MYKSLFRCFVDVINLAGVSVLFHVFCHVIELDAFEESNFSTHVGLFFIVRQLGRLGGERAERYGGYIRFAFDLPTADQNSIFKNQLDQRRLVPLFFDFAPFVIATREDGVLSWSGQCLSDV